MKCPICTSRLFAQHTERDVGVVRRRRVCHACGFRAVTTERITDGGTYIKAMKRTVR